MKSIIYTPLLALSLAISAAGDDAALIAKGNSIAGNLVYQLGGEVKMQMEISGPEGSIGFCSGNALLMTNLLGKESGTSIRRVTLKPRNPVNAPNAEECSVLERWENMVREGKTLPQYEFKHISKSTAVYYKPVIINNEACLICHGEIAAGSTLSETLRSLYPQDKATGYKMGDLRGMIAITFPR